MKVGKRDAITDIAGVLVGHHHRIDSDAIVADGNNPGSGWATGSTVVRLPEATVAAVDVRGGGPGTRETDLLDPVNTVSTAHAIVLSGGSAFGLVAADGAMTELERAGIGLTMNSAGDVVPIVPSAVIFDLPVGNWACRPTADFGAAAVAEASVNVVRGSVGAGAGARAGALKGGVGTASLSIDLGGEQPVTVGALMVANPVGDVINPDTGTPWVDDAHHAVEPPTPAEVEALRTLRVKATVLNTTIGVIATDAALDTASTQRIAMAGHDGLAHAVRPAHSPLDGDTIFAAATCDVGLPTPGAIPVGMLPHAGALAALCTAAAIVTRRAIVDAVLSATSVAGILSYHDLFSRAASSRDAAR